MLPLLAVPVYSIAALCANSGTRIRIRVAEDRKRTSRMLLKQVRQAQQIFSNIGSALARIGGDARRVEGESNIVDAPSSHGNQPQPRGVELTRSRRPDEQLERFGRRMLANNAVWRPVNRSLLVVAHLKLVDLNSHFLTPYFASIQAFSSVPPQRGVKWRWRLSV